MKQSAESRDGGCCSYRSPKSIISEMISQERERERETMAHGEEGVRTRRLLLEILSSVVKRRAGRDQNSQSPIPRAGKSKEEEKQRGEGRRRPCSAGLFRYKYSRRLTQIQPNPSRSGQTKLNKKRTPIVGCHRISANLVGTWLLLLQSAQKRLKPSHKSQPQPTPNPEKEIQSDTRRPSSGQPR